jgi:tetratricopeptide (TPR) repeat protein
MPVYEVGEHRGRPYFSMKLIDGGSLAEQLPRYSGDQRATAHLLAAVARGVHHAHQRGLLHRDLKPANILIDSQGQPYVTDFGLARRVAADSGLTQSGAIVGTPSYMAPEQAAGRRDLSTAADVYSLGAILYTMLTSRPPFRADTPLETVREVLEVEPSRPRLHRRDVDRDLETICLKCLEKQPQRRYGSAEALAEDLARWLAGEPIRARRTSLFERAVKRARKNPAGAALVAVSALALAGLFAAGLVYQDQRARTAERELAEQSAHSRSRNEVHDMLAQGKAHLAREEWQTAKVEFEKALTATRDRPAMEDLRQLAHNGLVVADQGLAEDQARQKAAATYEQFLRDRDDVLLYGLLFVDVDVPANIAAAREAGATALRPAGLTIGGDGALALDPHFTAGQAATIREECYTILLLLAEAALQQAQPDHRLALRLLERAGELEFSTRTYYQRLARVRVHLGDQAGAQQARELADQTKPSGALDHFLLGADAARQGEREAAIEHFAAALDQHPDHFWAATSWQGDAPDQTGTVRDVADGLAPAE